MSISSIDQAHIWHPLTQHKTSSTPMPIERAEGAMLYAEDGTEYIDGIASWYTAMYGHCNPYIIEQVTAQMKTLDQIVFTGFTHAPATTLAQKVLAILPDNQQKIFFNDNGSTAVEAGIKMALQYHHNKGNKRNVLIAFENGFHGDTFGAMSVSGLSVYNGPFEDYFLHVERIPTPTEENLPEVLQLLQTTIDEHPCAGFVYEPLVQGAAGMQMYEATGLEAILKKCKANDIVTIADEVMTGFGKTGKHFASLYLETYPDIICLSKALTAGLVPMSLTTCTQAVYDAFLDDTVAKGFFHAHTYSANPMACAAAIAGIDLLVSDTIQHQIQHIHKRHTAFAKAIKTNPKAINIRVKGVIFALELHTEMERYGSLRNQLFKHFMDRGVCLRPLGNTIYILPPFVITDGQLDQIYKAIEEALDLF
ncbi:adenosylmethionine--8-amino-7-oxononanoate transaminase [uncultured Dokdonia sp.]|uniref:adenosylmethionine--8-amino-7-oxononanoate transaminase n=1 Tax=uncultured Dokdonia sp. TaxID=575653 RepID=UPI0026340920|nr:adenosylmethionine--8-amino-7-oxononanoate transaminase [uncultured Dokdonia sp.]